MFKRILTTITFVFFANLLLADRAPVKIGVITPLTGGMAIIGSALKNGIELAIQERSNDFRAVQFIYQDDQFDPKKSLSAYAYLKNVEKIQALFGFGDSLAFALAPLAERDRLAFLNFNFEAGAAVGRKYLVRTMNHTGQYMSKLRTYLVGKNLRKFVIVKSQSPFFDSMASAFEYADTSGIVTKKFELSPGFGNDFRGLILKVKELNPQAVGLLMSPDDLLNFLKQAKELNLQTEYFGTDLFETCSRIIKGVWPYGSACYPDNQVSSDFKQRYLERFVNDSQLTFAAVAYEMANLIADYAKIDDSFDSDRFLKYLGSIQERSGVLGPYSFRKTSKFGRYFEFDVVVKNLGS